MYICKYCGKTSQNYNYCKNHNCRYYGYSFDDCICNNFHTINTTEQKTDKIKPVYAKNQVFASNFEELHSTSQQELRSTMHRSYDTLLGFATVPMQKFEGVFPLSKVLETGTVFPELYMPYTEKIINRG